MSIPVKNFIISGIFFHIEKKNWDDRKKNSIQVSQLKSTRSAQKNYENNFFFGFRNASDLFITLPKKFSVRMLNLSPSCAEDFCNDFREETQNLFVIGLQSQSFVNFDQKILARKSEVLYPCTEDLFEELWFLKKTIQFYTFFDLELNLFGPFAQKSRQFCQGRNPGSQVNKLENKQR